MIDDQWIIACTVWKLASQCTVQLVVTATKSSAAVLQLTLRSGPDESRQCSTAFIVVDALALRALPLAGASGHTLTLNVDAQHNFTAHALGDKRISRGRVYYSWWFRVPVFA